MDNSIKIEDIVPTLRLDMVGEPCPYPAVATLEVMPQLNDGDILYTTTT